MRTWAAVIPIFLLPISAQASDERISEDLKDLLDRGFGIVAANEKHVFVQKDREVYYCYDKPIDGFPWLCIDMRRRSGALIREMAKMHGLPVPSR